MSIRRPTRLLVAMIAVNAAIVGGGLAAGATPSGSATRDPHPAGLLTQRTGLSLELIDQSFTLRPGATLRLVYRISGDLAGVAELAPPTTIPASTIPATTIPATTIPATTSPPTTAAPAPATPATTPAPVPTPPPATTEPAPSTTVPPPAQLTINIANFEPLTRLGGNERYLDRILGQRADAGSFADNVDGVQLADVRPLITVVDDRTATLTLEVPTDIDADDGSGPESLEFPDPGIYPLRVQLLVDDDLAATHGTVIERIPGDGELLRPAEPVTLAVLAHVDRPVDGSPAATDEQLQRVLALADAVDNPVLAAIPPVVLDAAVAADAAGTIARTLADDEVAASTDIVLDVSSAVAAGQGPAFTRALLAGEDLLTSALPTTPSRRAIWVAAAPLSGAGAQQLRDLGFRFAVFPPQLYADTIDSTLPATDRFVDVTLPDGDPFPVLVVDALSEQLTEDATRATLAESTPTEWAVRTVTEIVLDHRQSGRTVGRSRILSTPTLDAPDPTLLVALERLADTTTDVRFLAPSALIGVTDVQGSPGNAPPAFPPTAGPDLVSRLAAIDAARLDLASAASMLPPDDERLDEWNAMLDALVSTGITDGAADLVIDDLRADSRRLRAAVELPEPFTFTMTGRSDDITLRLGNTSDESLRVLVRLASPKLTFPDNDRVVTLRPNDSTDLQIAVRARSNGTSPVTVTVLTPLGEPLGEPVTLTSRVNALTGLGQVLTAGFVLMLLTWWFSSWRRRRRMAAPTAELEEQAVADDAVGTGRQ